MTLRNLSFSNGFIPQATGQVIAFIRDPSKYRLSQYVQYVPTPAPVGVYAKLGRDPFVRVVSDAEYAWEDGDERPRGDYHKVPFEWVEFRTFRRAYPWTIGYKAIAHTTAWSPKQAHAAMAQNVCLTNRTNRVITMLETAANWGDHASEANELNENRGSWETASDDDQSTRYLAIFHTLMGAAQQIGLDTNNAVTPDMLQVLVNPVAARRLAASREIVNYVRESPYAEEVIKRGLDPQFQQWGCPAMYRGFRFVVEDAMKVTTRASADGSEATSGVGRSYIKSTGSAVMVARPGSIDGEYGAPSFSTVQLYHLGGLAEVEAFDDPENRRVKGSVTEDIKEVLAAPVSGWLIENIFDE